jgi:hypothetical protein
MTTVSGIGTRLFIHIGGRAIPGIQTSEAVQQPVVLGNGRTIMGLFAEVLTLRETNPVAPDGSPQETTKYLTSTLENKRFTTLRFEPVVGLDFDENGVELTLQKLEEQRGKDIAARQVLRASQAMPQFVPVIDASQAASD